MKPTFLRNAPLVATIVASLSFGASLSSVAQPKDVTIGLAVANLQADFFNQIKQSVEAEAKAKGVTVVTVDAKGDSATQVSQVQDLITGESKRSSIFRPEPLPPEYR
jgi:ribose transport system substrate-binding protein